MAERKVITILNGPDRDALFESFKNHYLKRRDVKFLLSNEVVIEGSIYSLSYEDGSGGTFMFKMSDRSGKCHRGYYDMVRTTGWIADTN